ncbi:hypothetical protein [Georgenia wangjunii]|uniref:hypothetical protein n=1 Tax=Georgenia wangjunii TaxID=3117730 RepID=UPI002F265159
MYGLVWRVLPGPVWFRAMLALALIVGVVYVCFTWLFPEIAPYMPFNEMTLEETGER